MIDGLIYLRGEARAENDWELSDIIRDYLDTRNVFCFDKKDEDGYHQEVYHIPLPLISREEMIKRIQDDIRAEKNFDAWLYMIKRKTNY